MAQVPSILHSLVMFDAAAPFLYEVAPKRVYINKRLVLQQDLENLSLEMHEAITGIVGNNQMIGSVRIDVPPHNQYPMLHQRKFYGDYKLTEDEALESAYLAFLLYLQKLGIILVDDVNLSELTKREPELADCRYKLLAASIWADTFQELADCLKTKLAAANQENKKLIATAKALDAKKEVFTLPPL